VTVSSGVSLSAGVATYTLATTTLAPGTHTVQASYTGDGTYLGSRGAFTLNITAANQPDFTITPASATATATAGGVSNGVVLMITPLNGFTGDVSLYASGPSNLAVTPAFSAQTVHITGTASQTSTLTLLAFTGLAKTGTGLLSSNRPASWTGAGSGVLLASFALLLAPRRRRIGALLLVIAGAGLLAVSGCSTSGGPSTSTSNRTNAAPGTYVLTVSATGTVNGAAVTHTSTVNFTVQ